MHGEVFQDEELSASSNARMCAPCFPGSCGMISDEELSTSSNAVPVPCYLACRISDEDLSASSGSTMCDYRLCGISDEDLSAPSGVSQPCGNCFVSAAS